MKILVIGGMHGNEPLGLEVVKLLQAKPISNVDTLLANERAIQINERFVEADLNRSFPGDAASDKYEMRRAAEIIAASAENDIVLDFHNTQCPNNDCSFLGVTANQLLYSVSSWLNLKRVILADYDCLNKYAPNCLSIEISTTSKRMQAAQWLADIQKLAQLNQLPVAEKLSLYNFAYRMTQQDRRMLKLDTIGLKAFEPINIKLAIAMGVKAPAYPIFIGDGYTPYNYGGLLNEINV